MSTIFAPEINSLDNSYLARHSNLTVPQTDIQKSINHGSACIQLRKNSYVHNAPAFHQGKSYQSAQDQVYADFEKMMDRNSDIRKAFTSSDIAGAGDGGVLSTGQSNRFICLLRIMPTVLKAARVHVLGTPQYEVPRMAFTGRIFHTVAEDTAPSVESEPDTSKISMDTKEFVSFIPVTYQVLEETIERSRRLGHVHGGQIINTLINLIMGQTALDVEEFCLKSDVDSADADLALFDGWIETARDNNEVDNNSATLSKEIFFNTLLGLPDAYQNDPGLAWITPITLWRHWQDEIADRITTTADAQLFGSKTVTSAYGYPIIASGNMPSTDGASSDEATMLLTNPRNLVCGVFRNIMIDIAKNAQKRRLELVLSFRIDAKMEQPEGCVNSNEIKMA